MRLTLAVLAALTIATPTLAAPPAGTQATTSFPQSGDTTDYSQTLGTTPTLIWPDGAATLFSRITNAAATGGATVWCSRKLTATTTPALAPNTAGAYPLVPGNLEQFPDDGRFVPGNALWCVATAAGTPLTAEAR